MALPVFAGLGSATLFSSATQATALADSLAPEAQTLLNSCHNLFLAELSDLGGDVERSVGIALKDFQQPQSLLIPSPQYHKNAVLQNTTLCLTQLLRYLRHCVQSSDDDSYMMSGVAGICSGLIAAVAVAAHSDTLQYLSYGKQSFHLALLLGVEMEQRTRRLVKLHDIDEKVPWSMIVDGLKIEQVENLLADYERQVRLSIYEQ